MLPTRDADAALPLCAVRIRASLLEALRRSRIEVRQVTDPALAGLLEMTGDILDELRMIYTEFGLPRPQATRPLVRGDVPSRLASTAPGR